MFGEYKLAAYSVIGLLITAIGGTAVVTYNHAITRAEHLQDTLKERDNQIKTMQGYIDQRNRDVANLKQYQAADEGRQSVTNAKVRTILVREGKNDAQGNISPDDPVMRGLQRMFPGGEIRKDTAGDTSAAAMQQGSPSAGTMAGDR